MVSSGLALTSPDGERRSPSTGPPAAPGPDQEAPLALPEVDGVDGIEDALTIPSKPGASKQIRGSSLLLVGRMISLGTNFLVQVLIVRYLQDKADYGAFAYALSVVAIATTFVALGTDRAIGRFLPIYQERGRPDAMLGTVVFVTGTIASLGIASILLIYGLQDLVNGSILNEQAGGLLLILIILAPIQALDDVLMNGFAVFSSPRAIFFRRYVLNPALRLGGRRAAHRRAPGRRLPRDRLRGHGRDRGGHLRGAVRPAAPARRRAAQAGPTGDQLPDARDPRLLGPAADDGSRVHPAQRQ